MAASTVAYTDTTGKMDYLGMIASQIGRRLKEASDMASDERAFAEEQAEAGGTSLDEAGIGKGYFFKRALGSRFGGDRIARTKGRMGIGGDGTNPTGNFRSRFRGGFDYNITNEISTATVPLASALVGGLRGVENGLVAVGQAIQKLADGMDDLARAQDDVARQTIRNGAFMQAFLNYMQREGARQRARSEEFSLEGGGPRGGSLGGRGMINVTPPPSRLGSSGGRGLIGAADTFQTGVKLATNTKGAKKVGKAISGGAGAITGGLAKLGMKSPEKLLSAAKNAFKPEKAFQSVTKALTGDVVPNAELTKLLIKESSPNAVRTFAKGGALGAGTEIFTDPKMTKKMLDKVDDKAFEAFLDDMTGSVGSAGEDAFNAFMRSDTFANRYTISKADDAYQLFGRMVSGTFDGVQRSTDEALEYFKFIAGDADYAKYFGKEATKPIGKALKSTVTEQATKQATKQAAKLTGKAGLRSFVKKIPVIAGIAGIGFGIQRALEGDFFGAGLEITSGLLGAVSPLTGGAGTGLSYAIDGFLLGRDLGMMPMAKGGIVGTNSGLLSAATPVIAGEKGKEAFLPLDGAEGEIAGSVFGNATAQSLANFFFRGKGGSKKLENLRYNSDHPEGTDQPNPHPPGTFLHKNFERLRQMNILDPDMQISMLSSAAQSGEVANNLNKSSERTGMGTMMMPTTIINNNYAAAPAGGSQDLTDPSFPADVNDFITSFSLASK